MKPLLGITLALTLGLAASFLTGTPAFAAEPAYFPRARAVDAARPPAASGVPLLTGAGTTTLAAARGKWVWLYFGFANCPGVCPFAMDWIAEEYRRLKRPEEVQVVFVSVDPVRDTPDKVGPYAAYFHPSFWGVTGDKPALDAVTRSVGATYHLPPNVRATDEYSVGHPNTVYVLDPSGRLAAVYDPGTQAQAGALSGDFNALDPKAATAAPVAAAPSPAPGAGPGTGAAWCGIGPGSDDPAAIEHHPLMRRSATMGSGTSVLPAETPMRMWSLRTGDWLWMLHGDMVGGYNVQGGPRGDLAWAAENWQMAMGSRYLGPGILDVRLMTSLEPWTLPPGGTPQLFQTGETWQGRPLIDKQHPHDLLMEASARYTWVLDDRTGLFAYGGLAGEPALGPSAFMHRPSSADNHWAPLGHHQQDATHIAYGVTTLGARRDDWQLEGSVFNGREPDENRVGIDWGALDSWSTRLSWFPGRNWALQASYGRLREPERSHPGDVERITASMTHVTPLAGGWWSTSLIWGQNKEFDVLGRSALDFVLQSYGLESQLDWGENHLYGRYELVDKGGLPPFPVLSHNLRRVNALTLGAIRDIGSFQRLSLGLGADVTAYSIDSSLQGAYGANPLSFRVYVRLRPPTMGQPVAGMAPMVMP
jgi:cytochrome oxidase Cu insertion factor (SCO1/SenC/PrrC family)